MWLNLAESLQKCSWQISQLTSLLTRASESPWTTRMWKMRDRKNLKLSKHSMQAKCFSLGFERMRIFSAGKLKSRFGKIRGSRFSSRHTRKSVPDPDFEFQFNRIFFGASSLSFSAQLTAFRFSGLLEEFSFSAIFAK